MPTPEGTPVLVADDHDNEAVFPSIEAAVAGIQVWFDDVLEASCQGLSKQGIEEMFPGLLGRLQGAVASVPVPALELIPLAQYANAIAQKTLGVCLNDDEREAVGVPTQFSVRAASPAEVPDVAALADFARKLAEK